MPRIIKKCVQDSGYISDEKKLKIRTYGSFLVAVVYLACRYFA